MDKWTPDFWIANESECKKTLLEPGNWEKVTKIRFLIDAYKYSGPHYVTWSTYSDGPVYFVIIVFYKFTICIICY